MKPQIITGPDMGFHNENTQATIDRMVQQGCYKDLSCVQVVPAFGSVPTKVLASWMTGFTPPNQSFSRVWALGQEVGAAFSNTVEMILNHPQYSKFKYMFTLEHDNTIEPDTIVRLLEAMETNKEFACISALYHTKGFGGVSQTWGDITDPCLNFRPVPPRLDGGILETYGTGMGCAMWRLDMFKDPRFEKPWFKTCASQEEGVFTQDLKFWNEARKHGYRCAVHCGIKSGHYDLEGKFGEPDTTW